jgi:hypothetical protein
MSALPGQRVAIAEAVIHKDPQSLAVDPAGHAEAADLVEHGSRCLFQLEV